VKKIAFTSQAQADVRRLDQPTAMRIFEVLRRFAQSGVGDVKALKGESGECRLRIGDYRVRYIESGETLVIKRVVHRSDAYR
jgi:mRNA interferase RelE/StbE